MSKKTHHVVNRNTAASPLHLEGRGADALQNTVEQAAQDMAGAQDAVSQPQAEQSTSDVLGGAYSFQPGGAALAEAWQDSTASSAPSARAGAAWLSESGLARSLEAVMAFNPWTPVHAPRAVLQHGWFSTMFQMVEWPMDVMKRWSQEMDRTLDVFVWGAASRQILAEEEQSPDGWSAAVDLDETDEALKVRADLPGVADDAEVEVEVRDGHLMISGEVRQPLYADGHEPASDGPADGTEPGKGRFVRSIALPPGVDAYGAQACLRGGVLEVTLAGPALRQRRIEVSHGAPQRH